MHMYHSLWLYDGINNKKCENLMLNIYFCVYYENSMVVYMLLKICNATCNLHDTQFSTENRNNRIIFFHRCKNLQLILTFLIKLPLFL